MTASTPHRPTLRQWLLGVVLASAVGVAQALPEATAEEPGADAITQLLVDRGVLPAGSVNVMQSMRDRASDLVVSAMNFLGVPYRRGGNSAEDGFDCSGFTRHIFEISLGLVLPRRAADQANAAGLVQIPREELKPGDLVFFNTMRRAFSHVGIYVGDGKFIHSPRSGGEVRIESMRDAYWRTRFNGA
jgi:cell wall-associated NlpC family hydrolase